MRTRLSGARIPLMAALAGAGLAAVLAFAGTSAAAAPPGPAPGVTPGAIASSLYYTAPDGSVWTTDANPSSSFSVTTLGGRLVSAPAPISTPAEAPLVFGQGTDNELWSTHFTGTGWSPWGPLGGVLTSKPGAADVDATTYSVFARGSDGAVWERDHAGSAWDSWHSIGGYVLAGTGPAATYTADGQIWVVVTGIDHAIWYLNLAGNIPQSGWASLQGRTNSSPGLTAPDSSSVVAFARGTNNAGFYNEIIGGGQGWYSLGGRLTSGLAAGTDSGSPATTWVFGLGTDNQMYASSGTFPAIGAWTRVPT